MCSHSLVMIADGFPGSRKGWVWSCCLLFPHGSLMPQWRTLGAEVSKPTKSQSPLSFLTCTAGIILTLSGWATVCTEVWLQMLCGR